MRKTKAKLIMTLSVALLSVFTMGVSTFAWFQAQANVNVEAGSTDCEITVTKPDNIEVDTTNVYMYRGDPADKTVTSHYDLVGNAAARTISNFYPGDIVTFAVKVTATSGNIIAGSMNLTYRGYSLSNRTIRNSAPTKVINVLSAISVSTGANGTGSYPSMTQQLSPIARGSELQLSTLTRVGETTSYYKEATIENAINGASIGATSGYFFYTINFLNTTGTFYQEYDSTGNTNINTPTDSGTRYFTGSNSGSSTCYESLNFDIKRIAITIS